MKAFQFQLAYSIGFPAKLPRVSRVHCPWKPPPIGWLKCNADGAFDKVTQTGGVGVVVRDTNGVVVGGACLKLSHISSPELIEALASRAACELAIRFSLTPLVFEANSLLVVQATKCLDPNTSSVGRIYEDIVGYLKNLPGSSFSHVYRASNVAAHKLAKLALTSSFQVFWSENAPPEVSSFVATLSSC